MAPPRKVKCPTCKKDGDWFSAQYGPFCSHRCKLIDLGKWLNEQNKISEPRTSDRIRDLDKPAEHLDSADEQSDN